MPTVFYQGHDIVITDDVFAIWKPDPQVYDLESLEELHVEHVEGRPAKLVLLAVGALVTVGVVAGSMVDGPGSYAVMAAVIAVPPMAERAMRAFAPVTWALKAAYAGADVTLFTSSNVITFIRVRRSLMRAFGACAANVDRLDRTGYAEAYGRLDQLL